MLPAHSYTSLLVSFQAPFVFEAVISVRDHCDETIVDPSASFHLYGKGIASGILLAYQEVPGVEGGPSAYRAEYGDPILQYDFTK